MKQIVFTGVKTAELSDVAVPAMDTNKVKVRTAVSTVSCGTEKANILGDPNVNGSSPVKGPYFPRVLGYSSAGVIEEVGESVTDLAPGDRVVVYWGTHSQFNVVNRDQVVKIPYDEISFEEAAMTFIGTFPMAAVRKTRVEAGEAALVMGLGILGQLAVQLARASGAVPVIAADPVPERRAMALRFGADYALDPLQADFAEQVKALTGKGANVCIEVTGRGEGLNEALDCMARFGRVALLGCTRDSDFTVDYYHKVHFPGIQLIGAHTMARPDNESYPGYFTHRDDILAIMRLIRGKRINLKDMVCETHAPADCPSVYRRLTEEKNFPVVVQFDWRR